MKHPHQAASQKQFVVTFLIIVLAIFSGTFVWATLRPRQHFGLTPSHVPTTTRLAPRPEEIKPDPARPPKMSQAAPFVSDYIIPPIEDGMAPVLARIPTKQPVVFLGIDDGAYKDPSVVEVMNRYNIRASLFLSKAFIANNPDFFLQLTASDSFAENHTLSHDTRMVQNQTYEQQKREICGMADYETEHFGVRPTLYRPPGGSYSNTMRRAAAACGMRAVITWIAKANGGTMQYQVGRSLQPGDIVLMHFRPEFRQDMEAFIEAMTTAGLHTELLENVPSGF